MGMITLFLLVSLCGQKLHITNVKNIPRFVYVKFGVAFCHCNKTLETKTEGEGLFRHVVSEGLVHGSWPCWFGY